MSDDNKEIKRWQFASTDLKKALDQWDDLAREPIGPFKKLSPDEQKLKDMQKLIQELKNKLKEFEE